MKLTCEERDRVAVFTLQGSLTEDFVPQFEQNVTQRMDSRVRDFVLDMTRLEFIDSRGLEALLWLIDECDEKLGQVRLAGPTRDVVDALALTRLAPLFETRATVEEALESLN